MRGAATASRHHAQCRRLDCGYRRIAEDSVDGCGKGQAWGHSGDLLSRRRTGSDSEDSDLPERNQRRPDAEREDGIAENQCGVVTLDKKLFKRLVDSMGQMDEIVRGVRAPSREFYVDAAKVKEIRAIKGLSQPKFAKSTSMLERCEIGSRDGENRQGRRRLS